MEIMEPGQAVDSPLPWQFPELFGSFLDILLCDLHFSFPPVFEAYNRRLHCFMSLEVDNRLLPCLGEVQRVGDTLGHAGGRHTHGELGGDAAVALAQYGELADVLLLVELLSAPGAGHGAVLTVSGSLG